MEVYGPTWFWYNYSNHEYDIRDSISIENDELAKQYIPNTDFSHSMYIKYRKLGFSIKESMKQVLSLYFIN